MNRRIAPLALIVTAVALDGWACWQLAGLAGATNDLFPRWLATRLWLFTGADPYGAATSAAIREAMPAVPLGGDGPFVFGFVYPGYVALLLVPLALLPFPAAGALWLLCVQACTLGGALACWRAAEGERGLPRARPLAALCVAALFPATVMNLLFFQFAAPVFLGLALGWLQLIRHRERSAGTLLAVALFKPSLALFPLGTVLLSATKRRQIVLVVSFSAVAGTLALLSLALLPGWPSAFWRSSLDYAAVARPASAAGVLAAITGSSDSRLALVIGGLASAAIAAGWLSSRRGVGDAGQAGVLAGAWLVPPLYEWNNLLLLTLVVPALREAERHGPSTLRLAAGATIVLSALTALAYLRAPGEARLIWPAIALGVYGAPAVLRLRGRYKASDGSAALPPATRS